MKRNSRISSVVVSVLMLALLLILWLNRLAIYDWWRLRDYNPSAQIVSLASDTTMTNYARHMFYINHPVLQNRNEFNKSCPNDGGEQSIILGCYVGNQTGIFLFSVKDPKLAGVEQVTAAHETLHAAYERLNSDEKQKVNKMLEDFYKNELKDPRILATIDAYKKSEPNEVVNEMHSVFGSEVAKLSPGLEEHYKKYFSNRAKVVAFAEQYRQTFVDNQNLANSYLKQIKSMEKQLNSLRSQIDNQESDLRQQNSQLEVARTHVNAFNVNDFNKQVSQYNADVQAYRELIDDFNSLIVRHNLIVKKLQALNTETNQLYKELDSRSATVTKQ